LKDDWPVAPVSSQLINPTKHRQAIPARTIEKTCIDLLILGNYFVSPYHNRVVSSTNVATDKTKDVIMRLVAAIMTLLALAATGFAGQRLWAVTQNPPQIRQVVSMGANFSDDGNGASPIETTRIWPALFGELQPPKPPPQPEPPSPPAAAAEPKPPAPPIGSLGYRLKGVVRAGDAVWGLVSHPAGDQIVRVGRELAPGVTVQRIDEDGLWVDNGEEEPVLLGFDKPNGGQGG
jgi:hypothetical protein